MGDRSRAPLISLAASIGLVGVYIAFGGGSYTPAATADPCEARDQSVLEERGVFEGIALSALDGAACQLHVSRTHCVSCCGQMPTYRRRLVKMIASRHSSITPGYCASHATIS